MQLNSKGLQSIRNFVKNGNIFLRPSIRDISFDNVTIFGQSVRSIGNILLLACRIQVEMNTYQQCVLVVGIRG